MADIKKTLAENKKEVEKRWNMVVAKRTELLRQNKLLKDQLRSISEEINRLQGEYRQIDAIHKALDPDKPKEAELYKGKNKEKN